MYRSSLVGVAALIATSLVAPVQAEDDDMAEPAPPAPAEEAAKPRPAAKESIQVALDLATVLRIPDGTDTLAIGNPSIADVTKPQSGGFAIVTGKSYGATNILALDTSGETISEMMVYVTAPLQKVEHTVVIQRGMARETWSCSPRCEPTATLGDSPDYFGSSSGQVGSRNGMAAGR